MNRIILILFLINSNLNSQDSKIVVKKEMGYSITNFNKKSDTILQYEIHYDSLGQKNRVISYPANDDDGVIRVIDIEYNGDTIIELYRTAKFDTLKQITLLKSGEAKLELKVKTFGWWMSGKYSKGISVGVRKKEFNKSNELTEMILYSEGRDTVYHYKYSYKNSIAPSISVREVRDLKSNFRSKRITQIGLGNDNLEPCDSNCTKYISIRPDSSNTKYKVLGGTMVIENGDTTHLIYLQN